MKVKKDKVKLITLGCSKNLVDSEFILSQLKSNDIEIVDNEVDAENVIINTCGFIEAAKQESIDTIMRAVDLKTKGKIKNVYVAGCLSDRYLTELEKDIPEVDKYFGATDKPQTIFSILNELGVDYKKNLIGERILTTPSHFAYLKISEGCDNPCSFCAIPIMRGGHRSKPLQDILTEAQKLASKGVKELVIIGQDTTYWGMDIGEYKKRSLSMVLSELSKIKGIEWIRLMYAYPSRFPSDLISTIRDTENICNYIDIPVQHISDNVLKSMRRGITKKTLSELLYKLRNEIPGIAIRTTLITGYPDESENDFNEMLEFVKDFKFDRLGVFTYSHEDGTYAAGIPDRIPQKEKQSRQKILLDAQRSVSIEKNLETVGKVIKVLIDRKENDYYIGRSYKDSPEIDQEIYINSKELTKGEFYDVKIFDAEEFDLFGEVIINK
ncbi:MAG TPA: 30S ribosomal protein S12 methylthiotransferase RimO [Ignavibacteria bacterium]|nr:30S ribosomal protein S12 methylthiotransferase RimO [Ignavibacteria bacterium]